MAPWPRPGAPWAGPERLGGPLAQGDFASFHTHPVWLSFGGKGHCLGRILGAAGAWLGTCLLLFTPSSQAPSPKKSGDGVWVRGDHDLHCPLAHPEHHPPTPSPRSRPGFASSRESLASVGAAL